MALISGLADPEVAELRERIVAASPLFLVFLSLSNGTAARASRRTPLTIFPQPSAPRDSPLTYSPPLPRP